MLANQKSFDAAVAPVRRALHVHCYRMVGSFTDAEDLVQDALLRAWQARAAYDAATGDVGLRRWLYRIATNACLDFLKSAPRRAQAQAAGRSIADVPWLEPYPDRLLDELPATAAGPDALAASKETIALGYLALIQILPPQQRAVFVLREVLGWSAGETAEALALSVAAANSALQRARDTVERAGGDAFGAAADAASHAPSADEHAALAAFIATHQTGDVAAAKRIMSPTIRVTMPPFPDCFVGIEALAPLWVRAFGPPAAGGMGDWRAVPAWANRHPAALSYLRRPGDTVFRAFKIDVLRLGAGGLVQEITTFGVGLIRAFDLPDVLEVHA